MNFRSRASGAGKGEGIASCGQRPGFEIGQIRGQGAERILAYAFLDQMAERLDILIRQNPGQHVAPVHREDGGNRIELQCTALTGGFGQLGQGQLP